MDESELLRRLEHGDYVDVYGLNEQDKAAALAPFDDEPFDDEKCCDECGIVLSAPELPADEPELCLVCGERERQGSIGFF